MSEKTNNSNPDLLDSRKRGQWRGILTRLFRNKLAVFGLMLILILVFSAVFAPYVAPYDYAKQDYANTFSFPSADHLMGTDEYGRDILSRVIYGGRVSLLVAIMAIAMSLVAGGLLGVVAGYFSGRSDSIIMRIVDILQAVPPFLLAICISAALGTGVEKTAIALAIGYIPSYARIMRAQVLSIRGQEYVEAARLSGASHLRIMLRHIAPNTLSPIIVDSTLKLGDCILSISGLSFIGLGVRPPTPEWGSMLSVGRQYIMDFWPMVVFPGLAIIMTLFGFNLFGDGLRDALDPRLKR